ncbi:MAG: hypothetical protein IT355_14465 [Gemmatimonadaceae bacterium]|nr:hypothetical protein [Gemmatimonadaceae bacterium]
MAVFSMRITIIVESDRPEALACVDAWMARWRERLASCSDNRGCGCCVHIWEVEAPDEAVAELPAAVWSVG